MLKRVAGSSKPFALLVKNTVLSFSAPSRYLGDEEREVKGRMIRKTVLQPPNTTNQLVFTLDNVFTPQECREWIAMSERKGYEAALVNIGGGKQLPLAHIRDSSRCIIDDACMAGKLMGNILPFLPDTCTYIYTRR